MITRERVQKQVASPRAAVHAPDTPARRGPGADPILWLLTGIMAIVGCLIIFDAGFARSIQSGDGVIPTEFRNQVIFAVGSGLAAIGITRMRPVWWLRMAVPIFIASFVLLLLVKVIGLELNGAQRWIKVGPITIQPAEFMKLAAIIFVAKVLHDRKPWKQPVVKDGFDWGDRVLMPKLGRMLPMVAVLAAVYCIEREPDLGTAAVVGATCFFMFLFGGITRKSAIWVTLASLVLVGAFIAKEPFRMERVTNHFHRWEADRIDDVGYQTVQSEIAMASGNWAGVGIGAGRVKHLMPAATTDFVFATVAEETGFLGVMAVLGLMAGVVWRLFRLGQKCVHAFARHVCFGVALWLTIQATVNLMMANGFLPPIGIPFPFISSGGSSLLAVIAAIAICQSVASLKEGEIYENRRHRRGNRRARLSRA